MPPGEDNAVPWTDTPSVIDIDASSCHLTAQGSWTWFSGRLKQQPGSLLQVLRLLPGALRALVWWLVSVERKADVAGPRPTPSPLL